MILVTDNEENIPGSTVGATSCVLRQDDSGHMGVADYPAGSINYHINGKIFYKNATNTLFGNIFLSIIVCGATTNIVVLNSVNCGVGTGEGQVSFDTTNGITVHGITGETLTWDSDFWFEAQS